MVVTHDTHIRTIQKVSTVCAQVQQKYSPSICTCTAVLPHPLVALSRICETATNFFKLCLVIFKFTEWLTNSPVRDKNFFFYATNVKPRQHNKRETRTQKGRT